MLRKEKEERIKNPNKELIRATNEDQRTRYHLVALFRYQPQALSTTLYRLKARPKACSLILILTFPEAYSGTMGPLQDVGHVVQKRKQPTGTRQTKSLHHLKW